MERTYTEKEIKDWFDSMMKEYQNCAFNNSLQAVYDHMFDPLWHKKNLATFAEKDIDKSSST